MRTIAPEENKVSFGEFVRSKRTTLNLSQGELAAMAHTTQGYISKLEKGLREPTLEVALNICDALRTDINEYVRISK